MSGTNKLIVLKTGICITVDLLLRLKRGGALSSPNFTSDRRNLIEQEEYASKQQERERKKETGALKEELTSKQSSIEELTLKTGWRHIYGCHLSIPSTNSADLLNFLMKVEK